MTEIFEDSEDSKESEKRVKKALSQRGRLAGRLGSIRFSLTESITHAILPVLERQDSCPAEQNCRG